MPKEIFSKNPLKEVIFEARFATNMSAACRRELFYDEIKKDYPNVILPQLSFEQHPFAQPFQYVSADTYKKITCSADVISFSTTKYASFTVFKDECLKLLKLFFLKYPSVDKIKRIGFRYVNHIGINSHEDIQKFLTYTYTLPKLLQDYKLEFFQKSFFLEIKKNTSGIRINVNLIKDNTGKNFLLLDFDLISLKEILPNEIEKYIDDYHDKIEGVFLSLITEAFKGTIR